MYLVICEINFSYGHRLLNYDGKCAHIHGHNARVQLEVSSQKLNSQGMVMDFYEIRKAVAARIDEALDHRLILQSSDPLAKIISETGEPVVTMDGPPTAEALARWIFDEARTLRVPVSRVTLWETPTSAAVYHE
ncbi:MAG: 6-carboxytetrahydropterin synthase [Candidatus Omnitrophota bacterium]|nr:6-carboxytetrahydropterin synthase [Candidatus Omnitrophota bacterium]